MPLIIRRPEQGSWKGLKRFGGEQCNSPLDSQSPSRTPRGVTQQLVEDMTTRSLIAGEKVGDDKSLCAAADEWGRGGSASDLLCEYRGLKRQESVRGLGGGRREEGPYVDRELGCGLGGGCRGDLWLKMLNSF
jgi:hypothetical protein